MLVETLETMLNALKDKDTSELSSLKQSFISNVIAVVSGADKVTVFVVDKEDNRINTLDSSSDSYLHESPNERSWFGLADIEFYLELPFVEWGLPDDRIIYTDDDKYKQIATNIANAFTAFNYEATALANRFVEIDGNIVYIDDATMILITELLNTGSIVVDEVLNNIGLLTIFNKQYIIDTILKLVHCEYDGVVINLIDIEV